MSRIVNQAPLLKRSIKQFQIDLVMFCGAGFVVCFYNLAVYGFPFVQSGLKVVLGFGTVGLFAAIDLALESERLLSNTASKEISGHTPPDELYPLTRKFTMISIVVVVLLTTITVLIVERDLAWFGQQSAISQAMEELKQAIFFEIAFIMGVLLVLVINLIYSYSRNLKLLFHNQTHALEQVSKGELDTYVPVITNDEFGFIAGHTNTMIEGLKDRIRLLEGVKVAQEVQQNLIPHMTPFVDGFDIAAQSVFSDETGGDYLDFIDVHTNDSVGLGIVLGDVTGHGVGAALLMASVRGYLRQRAALTGSLADMVGDVNKQLSSDTGSSGRFMSLFLLMIDPEKKDLSWVSAGHDPAILYDPANDTFGELAGSDLVLGVESDWSFSQKQMDAMQPGQILVLATDGIWEAHNENGQMFGKDRLKNIIRKHADQNADSLKQAVFDDLHNFVGRESMDDDASLVVIKAQ